MDEDQDGSRDLYIPLKRRRGENEAATKERPRGMKPANTAPGAGNSLLMTSVELRRRHMEQEAKKTAEDRQREEDARIYEAQLASSKRLASTHEVAHGIKYTEPMKTSWQASQRYMSKSAEEIAHMRERYHVEVEGEDVPCLIPSFQHMRIPEGLVRYLEEEKGIRRPTTIQMQSLPASFAGRDMVGIASTGSGKTLAFSLPALLLAVEEEMRCAYVEKDGPVALLLAPSRELARQTFEVLVDLARFMTRAGYPGIHIMIAIGGVESRVVSSRGTSEANKKIVHIAVGTPGRVEHVLKRGELALDDCKYLCMDEADRLLDEGFQDTIRGILSYFKHQRQTVMYSATMPQRILDFMQSSLVKPVIVRVGRTGTANASVTQHVRFVSRGEDRVRELLRELQKTEPPVIVFANSKGAVDVLHEELLVYGVDATSLHGGRTQKEREDALDLFKTGVKDVLVANKVASKGLDIADIRHVIVYEFPHDFEDYIHEIGRTGRSGNAGLATAFVDEDTPPSVLVDLKCALLEARQDVPAFLEVVDVHERGGAGAGRGCLFCGGLGHTIGACPKVKRQHARQMRRSIVPGLI